MLRSVAWRAYCRQIVSRMRTALRDRDDVIDGQVIRSQFGIAVWADRATE